MGCKQTVRAPPHSDYGFVAYAPSGIPITHNYIRSPHLHGFNTGGALFQDGSITNNRFDLFVFSDNAVNQGIQLSQSFGISMGGSGNHIYEYQSPGLQLANSNPNNTITKITDAVAATLNRPNYTFPGFPVPYGL